MTENQEKKPESASDTKFILTITLKLLVISAITALLLAGVNALTAPTIAANNELEKKNAISLIFPDANDIEAADVVSDGVESVYIVMKDGDLLGYAASVAPVGFGGAMDIMVGVNSDGCVEGIKIVSHSETPGLGSRVDSDSFLGQYKGLGGNVAVGQDVDAITGSTISSEAVTEGVNSALAVFGKIFSETDAIGGLE